MTSQSTTSSSPNPPWDVVVVGGGAAGLAAAQALGRSLRRVLVIDAGSPRNRFARHMHNVVGLDGLPPLELLARGRAEAERYGVRFEVGLVLAVRELANVSAPDGEAGADGARLVVELADGRELRTRAVIAATGVSDELPPIPGLAERWGETVLHCPYCHGWEVRGLRLAVAPTSPMALHQVRLLRQWSDDVTVFTAGLMGTEGLAQLPPGTRDELHARGMRLVDVPVVALSAPAPGVQPGNEPEVGSGGAFVLRTVDGHEYLFDALFTAGRLVPQDGFLDPLGLVRAENPNGSFVAVDQLGLTSHPRVWAVGNLSAPFATVPAAAAAGGMAGAAVNAALVEDDFARAVGSPASLGH